MHFRKIVSAVVLFFLIIFSAEGQSILLGNARMKLTLHYGSKASITSLVLNGQPVISGDDGIYTSMTVGGVIYSSLHLLSAPVLVKNNGRVELRGIRYGDKDLVIDETWIFANTGVTGGGTPGTPSITWEIQRSCSKALPVDESTAPVFHFNHLSTWEGAYQGYGGLAWFYLFNENLCTYGVHTSRSSFWNSHSNLGLDVSVDAPGKAVAMRYTRTADSGLDYAITVSDKEMLPKFDSTTHRRRYIRGRTDVWAPSTVSAARSTQRLTLSYFDFDKRYGRGKFVGLNGSEVSAVLNTIARIGVIDSLHYGGNSWHTPYGPICLHEQYIAQLGLAIDDPSYLKGYQSCLDFYRDHAIEPDGRVYPRWAYSDEDMMPGKGNADGFYEAQWGILMDSNPDFVSNVADEYDLTGDSSWVRTHQLSCEAALDYILRRDHDGDGLVEMMTDSQQQRQSSDWIDIIWASYENAFVNAKLYHALVKWAAIERQLGNDTRAADYEEKADKLKTAFNKPISEGGFWDADNNCYVHWIDKEKKAHGRNMVTPVNFMAIAYGICDDDARRKLILDTIEAQMEREKLFFWPLCMTSYAPGEGNDWQWPFPRYENGDLFLSWGSIAVKAYAGYRPDLAVKYVRNVLQQYGKDGLAFQRYGRLKQDGLGDDILSGNSLAIVGLYQAIYGINPLYNRLLLDPHITPELAGTRLTYRFRGEQLTIGLDSGAYSITDGKFKVIAKSKFGWMTSGRQLSYFNGSSATASLQVTTDQRLTLRIGQWSADKMEWVQEGKALGYMIHQLKPNTDYRLMVSVNAAQVMRSDANGDVVIRGSAGPNKLRIALEESVGTVQPRIVNIVNFIRLLEPRDSAITEDVLYQTVVKQVELMRKNKLSGTFLLQYDALIDARYQQLLRSLPRDSFDIGAWWEIPQPLVEKAGMHWRGQYPWDWRANIGFSTGYTPAERKKLADVYMADFKKIFGYYPKSVGCWFIDEVTLDYLYHQYGIVASCNCKDQSGTDGYTLWGGYWNQAYYPSKVNAYMPAQDEASAIPVPIFRMLGSDPIRQYDDGVGVQRQHVVTLEPVYKDAGGDSAWVNWFFKELIEGESLAFGYTQAGQENSFTWDAMAKGLGIQFPLIAKLRDEKKVRVETLAESGRWFRQHYRVTPATAVTINEDLPGSDPGGLSSDRRTVWYDSRFYRANLLWERTREGASSTRSDSSVFGLRFRDIHLFNEHFPSPYLSKTATSNECAFFTLPVVDGYRWSKAGDMAGLRLMTLVDGHQTDLEGGVPVIGRSATGALHITWPLTNVKGTLVMDLDERSIRMKVVAAGAPGQAAPPPVWFMDFSAAPGADLPFQQFTSHALHCRFEGMDYSITTTKGTFSRLESPQFAWRITPEGNELMMDLAR